MIDLRYRAVMLALGASILSAAPALDCATAPSPPAEPARPAEVPGLVPLSGETSVAADSASPSEGDGSTEIPAAGSPSTPAGPSACPARAGAHAVKRSALSRTLDAGLGTWLRGVDIEPKIDRGKFRGWLVRKIYAGDPCWADVDLHAGDVVSRINRHPIERPEQAQAVWTALRTSGEIVVEFLRAGRPRTLKFAVVDDAS